MTNRFRIQQNLYRRTLRKQMRLATKDHRRIIRTALDDDAVFETAYEQAMQGAIQHANQTGEFNVSSDQHGSPIVDNLLKLLTWFLENGPELVRMIELIVGLFSDAQEDPERLELKGH